MYPDQPLEVAGCIDYIPAAGNWNTDCPSSCRSFGRTMRDTGDEPGR